MILHSQPFKCPFISCKASMTNWHGSLICKIFCRYRQILDKAIQFTDADQLESLKAFVEASMRCLHSFYVISIFYMFSRFGSKQDVLPQYFYISFNSGQ